MAACVPRDLIIGTLRSRLSTPTQTLDLLTFTARVGKIGVPSIVGGQTVEEQTRRDTVCDTPERRYHDTRGRVEHDQSAMRGCPWIGQKSLVSRPVPYVAYLARDSRHLDGISPSRADAAHSRAEHCSLGSSLTLPE